MTVGELREKLAHFAADTPVIISFDFGHEAFGGKLDTVIGWRHGASFLEPTVQGAEYVSLSHKCLFIGEGAEDDGDAKVVDQYLLDADDTVPLK